MTYTAILFVHGGGLLVAAEEADYGGYRIERTLGSGGMGVVYLAQHPRLPRKDALKVLTDRRGSDPDFQARFLREAEIAARLQHPNLVAVRDRGEQDGRLWIAIQYVEGIDLAELIARGPLDPAYAVWILTEAARGLDEVHRAGLLHRDVKPANILLSAPVDGSARADGRAERVLITDFGIARAADDSATTAGGHGFSATLSYAAPEQINGGTLDHRTDVYALGCTLYQMLTGSVPFPRNSPAAAMYAHLNEPPPRPSLGSHGVSTAFDTVIAKAMAKDPADRYHSCGALADAAREALSHRDAPSGRTRMVVACAAIIAVVVAAAVTVAIGFGSDSAAPAVAARHPNTTAVEPANWGEYAYIPSTFPALLPPSPMTVGYQGMSTCVPTEYRSTRVLPLDRRVEVGMLYCLGDRDPVYFLTVTCNANRSPFLYDATDMDRLEGDEPWTRPTGSGHLYWGTTIMTPDLAKPIAGKTMGLLEVYFEDATHNYCRLHVTGADTGAELRDRWWPQAPV